MERDAFTYVVASGGHKHASGRSDREEPYLRHAYRVHFVGGAAQRATGAERMSHYANYFLGNDPAKWAGGVGVFGAVDLEEVYPGISLHADADHGLKYDWLVAAGADAARIRLRFEGQDMLEVRDGLVFVTTSAGQVIEQRPVAWSEVRGERIPVPCEYVQDGNEISYRFPKGYDARYPLVIDPTVIFGSYSGSSANNFGFTATYDNAGHLYAGGIAFGIGYPVTLGVLQFNYGGDVIDMALTKFAPDGMSLIWSTYLGGQSGNESPHSMVVDSNDELYVMGVTGASDFPTTAGCLDASFGFGPQINFVIGEGYTHFNGADAVIAHFSNDATQLLGSTFIGGSQADGLNLSAALDYNYGDPFRGEIILDAQERPIMVTSTISTDMPVSANATQPSIGGAQDAYVCMLDPSLSTLLWGTYHGGSLDDSAFGVQQAGDGRIYVTGGTQSADLPMAGTPYHASSSGGVDGYITGYSADGSAMVAATYLGTAFYDQSYFVQLDQAGFVYVVGQTRGAYPVSAGVYSNPGSTQFIHKLDHDLTNSQWSTRIGSGLGTEDIAPSAFLVSDCGQIYFSGWGGTVNQFDQAILSTTTGLPVTSDAIQSTTDGSDFYLMVLNADAVSLAYATFYGGTLSAEHVDGGTSRFDKDGIVYQAVCAGCWNNSDFPTTPGAWSNTNNAGVNACNLGVFKIDFEQNVQVNIDANITASGACVIEPILFSAIGTADDWAWDLGDGTLSTEASLEHLYSEAGTYTIMLVGSSTGLCVAVDTAYLEVSVVEPLVLEPLFQAEPTGDCDAVEVELFNLSTGSTIFFWDLGDGTASTQTNPVHAYPAPGDYTITLGVVDVVCADTAFLTLTVPVQVPGIDLQLPVTAPICPDGNGIIDAGPGFDSYTWSTNETTQSIAVSEAGTYSVEVTDGFCAGADTIVLQEAPSYPSLADVDLCPGSSGLLQLPFEPLQVVWSDGSSGDSLFVSLAGTYWFNALDPWGCPVQDTLDVRFAAVATGTPFIPNVFTPNGDEKNDRFLPTNVDATDYSMDIYNRWGMKVFSTVNSGIGWNGKLDNGGDTVPDGTYFVILTYSATCDDKKPVTVTGHVTLLR